MHWCDSVIHQQLNLTIQQLQLTMFRQANTGKKYGNEQFQWQLLCFCVTDVHARLCATAYCIQYICNCVSSRQTAGLRKVFWHVDLTQSCHRRKVELYDLFPCSYRALFRPALDAVSSCRHRPVVLHSQLGAQSDWHLSSYPPPPPHPNTHTHTCLQYKFAWLFLWVTSVTATKWLVALSDTHAKGVALAQKVTRLPTDWRVSGSITALLLLMAIHSKCECYCFR